MRRIILGVALSALPSVPALAQEETVLTPSGPWEKASSGDQCRIERKFEANGQPHLLILEQNAPGPGFAMAVAGPSLVGLSSELPVRINLTEGHPGIEESARIEPNRQFGQVAVVSDLTIFAPPRPKFGRVDTEFLGFMDRVAVAQGDTQTNFVTGSLADAAQMLNECTAQTLRSWGLEPKVQYGIQRTAFPLEAKQFARKMLRLFTNRNLRSGPFEAIALVDASGTATGCLILPGPGYDDLDSAACKAIKKARYLPALDAEGRPVASFWKTSFKFNVLDPYMVQLRMNPGEL
jgi:hypothetical protein